MGMRSLGHWKKFLPVIASSNELGTALPHVRLYTLTNPDAPFCSEYKYNLTLCIFFFLLLNNTLNI